MVQAQTSQGVDSSLKSPSSETGSKEVTEKNKTKKKKPKWGGQARRQKPEGGDSVGHKAELALIQGRGGGWVRLSKEP